MNTKIFAIIALAIFLVAGFAGVRAHETPENDSDNDSDDVKGDKVDAGSLGAAEKLEDKTKNVLAENENKTKREAVKEKIKDIAEDENKTVRQVIKDRVEEKTGVKINQGRLIKEVQQVRKEQFKITKEILRSENYTGSMDEFATDYNQALKELKAEIRAKIESGDTSDLNMRIVRNLAEERLIKARTDAFAKLNITVDNVTVEFAKHLNDKQKLEVLRADIRGTTPKFRLYVYAVMKNGTPEEQAALKAQLEAYATSINGTVKKVQVKEVDISKVRSKLNKNERVLSTDLSAEASASE